MNLKFVSTHLSIKQFPNIQLPDLTIITGTNGTGKSHFLQAISQGNLNAGFSTDQIRIFDTTRPLVPNNSSGFAPSAIESEQQNRISQLEGLRNQHVESLRQIARNNSLLQKYISTPFKLLSRNAEVDLRDLDVNQQLQIEALKSLMENQILSQFGGPESSNGKRLLEMKSELSKNICLFDENDMANPKFRNWVSIDIFQQSISRIFLEYVVLLQQSILSKHSEGVLLNKEAYKNENVPPWVFFRQAMQAARLPFDIEPPKDDLRQTFNPKLVKTTTGEEVTFASLSSGEKTLMAFALCLYHATDERSQVTFPKLLLLDEVDAHLHPSMVRHFLSTIVEVLNNKYGVKVILTTHSPTTVALAPDDAIYIMKQNIAGLHKAAKNEALNLLCEGVPNIAIAFDGRRTVFVESANDARLHTLVYEKLKTRPELSHSERSVTFLEVGTSNTNGDVDNGCARVKETVKKLNTASQSRIFGLLDWDTSNVTGDNIVILAEGVRYSTENLFLDPLCLLLIFLQDNDARGAYGNQIVIPTGMTFNSMKDVDHEMILPILENIQKAILGVSQLTDKVEVRFVGGFKYKVDKRLLEMNGHDFEKKVKEKFGLLKAERYKKGLCRHVAESIFHEYPEYIPIEFLNAYETLLAIESH